MLVGALNAISLANSTDRAISLYARARTVSSGTVWIGRTVSQSLQLGQCQMKRWVL